MKHLIAILCLAGCAAAPDRAARDDAMPNLAETMLVAPALASNPAVMEPKTHRLQVLISEVVDAGGAGDALTLRRHGFRVDAEYFYPASTIKLAAAIAACQTLNEFGRVRGTTLGLDTPMTIAPLFEGERTESLDPENLESGRITPGHEIRELFIVSDNPAFNRLYELVGQDEVNKAMWSAGLESVRISHRLSIRRTAEQNRRSRPVTLHAAHGDIAIPERRGSLDLTVRDVEGLLVGDRHVSGSNTIESPMDFSTKNYSSLRDLQDMLVKVVRPDIDLGTPSFGLSDSDRDALMEAMRIVPRESANPQYDPERYPDDWVKFLLPGLNRVAPRGTFTVYNKVGLAYGFMIENAYVVHEPSGRGLFVTATVYSNPNGTLNDNTYGYETVSLPFFAALGEAIGRYLQADR